LDSSGDLLKVPSQTIFLIGFAVSTIDRDNYLVQPRLDYLPGLLLCVYEMSIGAGFDIDFSIFGEVYHFQETFMEKRLPLIPQEQESDLVPDLFQNISEIID